MRGDTPTRTPPGQDLEDKRLTVKVLILRGTGAGRSDGDRAFQSSNHLLPRLRAAAGGQALWPFRAIQSQRGLLPRADWSPRYPTRGCLQTRNGLTGDQLPARNGQGRPRGFCLLISLAFQTSPSWSLIPLTLQTTPPWPANPFKLQMGPAEVRMGEVRVPGNEVCELGFLPTCAAQ